MPRFILIGLLCWFNMGQAVAQSKRIDNLRAVLAKHLQPDTFRVNRLNELAREGRIWFSPTQLDSVADQAFGLAKQLNYPYGQADALLIKSIASFAKGDIKQTYAQIKQAASLAQRGGNKSQIISSILSLGLIAPSSQRQAYFRRAVALAQVTKDENLIFNTYMGILNDNREDYPLALQWALPWLANLEKGTNLIHQYSVLSQVAGIYEYFGVNWFSVTLDTVGEFSLRLFFLPSIGQKLTAVLSSLVAR